jgi:fimbrial chaperone protein
VDPIRLEIGAGRRTASVRVRNEEGVPVTIRAYPLNWSQVEGEDRYEDSSAVIVSPPIFTIPAGGSQVVRVGLRTPSSDPHAYRLVIEEVPQARTGTGVQVALRLNLPLFVMMAQGEQGDLAWSAARGSDGAWTVEAANRGGNYVRVEMAAAEAATGINFADTQNFGVVLPGAIRRWTIGAIPNVRDQARLTSILRTSAGAHAQLATRGQ